MMNTENVQRCPCCLESYSTKVPGRKHSFESLPYLLNCGHSVCTNCIRNTAQSQTAICCPICKTHSPVSNSCLNNVNFYMVGQIFKRPVSQKIPDISQTVLKAALTSKATEGPCVFCSQSKVTDTCNQCGLMCKRCLDLKHSSVINEDENEHVVISLKNAKLTDASICNEHKRAKDYYCKDDNEFLCASCGFSDKHRSHSIVEFTKWKNDNIDLINEAVNKATKVDKILHFSEKNLMVYLKNLESSVADKVLSIKNEFNHYHGLLQLREEELLKRNLLVFESNVKILVNKLSEIKKRRLEVRNLAVGNEKLLQVVQSWKTVPNCSMKCNFGKSIFQDSSEITYESLHQLLNVEHVECFVEFQTDDVYGETQPKGLNFSKSFIDCLSKCCQLHSLNSVEALELKPFSKLSTDILSRIITENTALDRSPVALGCESQSLIPAGSCNDGVPSIEQEAIAPPQVQVSKTGSPKRNSKRALNSVQSEEIKVLHIVSPDEFYVRRSSDFHAFRKLMNDMKTHMSELSYTELALENVFEGQLYMLNSDENGWVRARVIEKLSRGGQNMENGCEDDVLLLDSSLICCLVDFGRVERVDLTKLREIPDKFLSTPEYAIKCCLHCILPFYMELGWSESAINQFNKYVFDKDVQMRVYENNTDVLSVDLGSNNYFPNVTSHYIPVSVRDALIFLELAHFSCTSNLTMTQSLDFRFACKKLPAPGSQFNARLCFGETYPYFFVHPVESINLYEDMINKIQDLSLDSAEPLSGPQIGMPCFAQYRDKVWYRAEILSVQEGSNIHVLFVDYGNEYTLSYKKVRCIDQRFLELPKLAMKCCLADVELCNGECSRETIDWFCEYVGEKEASLRIERICDEILYVSLHRLFEDEYVNVNVEIVIQGHCCSTGPLSQPPPVIDETTTLLSLDNYITQEIQDYDEIKISFVTSPECIYVRNAKFEDIFHEIHENLRAKYGHSTSTLEVDKEIQRWNVSDLCAVCNAETNIWYRAKIRSISDDNIEVLAIDVGTSHMVNVQAIYHLPDDLQRLPAAAIECHLHGISPAGGSKSWSSLANEYLAELVLKESISLIKMGEKIDGSLPIELTSKIKKVCDALEPTIIETILFTDFLVDKGVALPLKRRNNKCVTESANPPVDETCYSINGMKLDFSSICDNILIPNDLRWKPNDMKLKKGQKLKVRVTSVGENAVICFHDLNAITKLEDIKVMLRSSILNKRLNSQHFIFNPGDSCIAQYTDGDWYRAEVLDVNNHSSENKYGVLFTDYGTVHGVGTKQIRKYIGDAMDIPLLSFSCNLSGITPVVGDTWAIATLKWLSELIVDVDYIVEVIIEETNDKLMQVDLNLESNENVQQLMVKLNHAIWSPSRFRAGKKKTRSLACLKGLSPSSETSPARKPNICLPKGTLVKLNFVRSVAPNKFYATYVRDSCFDGVFNQSINDQLEEFEKMTSELNNRARNWHSILNVEKNILCCGYSNIRNHWVRTLVHSVVNDKEIKVFLVDFGDIEEMSISSIRSMSEEFASFPKQATLYQLHQVLPENEEWSSVAVSTLEQICRSNNWARIKSDIGSPVQVDLLQEKSNVGEPRDFTLAYQSLIDSSHIKLVRSP